MEDEVKNAVSAPPAVVTVSPELTEGKEGGSKLWIVIVAAVLIVGLLITGLVLLIRSDTDTTSHWRDIFIIVMALESLVIGLALVILIVQLATLINLIQNEVKPILNSTSETVNTLKGTTKFLSENLTGPVIELNATMAAVKAFFDVIRPGKSNRRR
jgi:MFS family permease